MKRLVDICLDVARIKGTTMLGSFPFYVRMSGPSSTEYMVVGYLMAEFLVGEAFTSAGQVMTAKDEPDCGRISETTDCELIDDMAAMAIQTGRNGTPTPFPLSSSNANGSLPSKPPTYKTIEEIYLDVHNIKGGYLPNALPFFIKDNNNTEYIVTGYNGHNYTGCSWYSDNTGKAYDEEILFTNNDNFELVDEMDFSQLYQGTGRVFKWNVIQEGIVAKPKHRCTCPDANFTANPIGCQCGGS